MLITGVFHSRDFQGLVPRLKIRARFLGFWRYGKGSSVDCASFANDLVEIDTLLLRLVFPGFPEEAMPQYQVY